jgi:O-methyltransferase
MPRPPVERFVRRLYRRWVEPHLRTPLERQRLKLAWFVWGYWTLLANGTLPLRTRLTLLRQFLRVDWHVSHAHTPREIAFLCQALATRRARPGEIVVEAGCWQGGSTAKLSAACAALGYRLHVFDSFEGVEHLDHTEGGHDYSGEYAAPETLVRANVARFGDLKVCTFHRGWFSDTLAAQPLRQPVRLVYIDCDLAKGTREVLAGVMPSLVADGVIFSQDCHIASVERCLRAPETWQTLARASPRLVRRGRRLARLEWVA